MLQRTMNLQDNIYADEQKQVLIGSINAQFDSTFSTFFINLQVFTPELQEQYKDVIKERYRLFYEELGTVLLENNWDLVKDAKVE